MQVREHCKIVAPFAFVDPPLIWITRQSQKKKITQQNHPPEKFGSEDVPFFWSALTCDAPLQPSGKDKVAYL